MTDTGIEVIRTPYITGERVRVEPDAHRGWLSRVTDESLRIALRSAISRGRRFVLLKCSKDWDDPDVEEEG